MGLAGAAVADEDDLLAVVDPATFGQRGDGGLWDLWVVVEAELVQVLEDGEAGVDETASLAPLGAFLVFGF